MSQGHITNFFSHKRRSARDSDDAPAAKRKHVSHRNDVHLAGHKSIADKDQKESEQAAARSAAAKKSARLGRPTLGSSSKRQLPAERPLGSLLSLTDTRKKKPIEPVGKFFSEEKPQEAAPASSLEAEKEEDHLETLNKFKGLRDGFDSKKKLPSKYANLKEKFVNTDVVLCLRHGSGTFMQVKEGVQRMTRKEYTEQDVGRMLTVLPAAYHLRQEKNRDDKYDLRMAVNTRWKEVSSEEQRASSFPKDPTKAFMLKTERKEAFHKGLLKIVEGHHEAFLEKLPVRPKAGEIQRWHPRFPVDTVPMMSVAEIPQPPTAKVCVSARDVLQMSNGALPPKFESALAKTAASSTANVEVSTESPSQPTAASASTSQSSSKSMTSSQSSSQSSVTSTTSSVPSSQPPSSSSSADKQQKAKSQQLPSKLLEKIRQKEAEKASLAMMWTEKDEEESERLSSLPDLCHNLCSVFRFEKRDTVALETVITKLQQSSTTCSVGELEKRLTLLTDMCSEFQILTTSRGAKWFKFPRSARNRMNGIREQLAVKIKEKRKSLPV